MKLSLYTAFRNCIEQDYPYLEMLRHHLPLADEIVVNEGFSTDGTFESLRDFDPKVKVFRTEWERPVNEAWCVKFKDDARRQCTGDWCVHLDSDEFIPEWEFDALRAFLTTTTDLMVQTKFYNFYANYRVYHRDPESVHWVTKKMNIHRNVDTIEFWGDGSNVKEVGKPFDWNASSAEFSVHHFGAVKDAAQLREMWWSRGRIVRGRPSRLKPPRLIFKLMPFDWMDSDLLPGMTV